MKELLVRLLLGLVMMAIFTCGIAGIGLACVRSFISTDYFVSGICFVNFVVVFVCYLRFLFGPEGGDDE